MNSIILKATAFKKFLLPPDARFGPCPDKIMQQVSKKCTYNELTFHIKEVGN
jgi:hypothetical protein